MKPRIREILEAKLFPKRSAPHYTAGPDKRMDDAIEAIAALYERASLILELLADSGGDAHLVGECIKAAQELLEQGMTLYIAQYATGYCLTPDNKERPTRLVNTLCGFQILLPLTLDEYNESRVAELIEDLKMCADCLRAKELLEASK